MATHIAIALHLEITGFPLDPEPEAPLMAVSCVKIFLQHEQNRFGTLQSNLARLIYRISLPLEKEMD